MRANLERVYRRHRQGLYTLSLSITRSPDQAEDAIQEALARLWKSPVRPRGDPVAYVFAAVRNTAIELRRRRRPEPIAPESLASIYDGQTDDPALAAMNAERFEALRVAVEGLGDEQREVVVMKIYGQLTFARIAEALGEPTQTVASRYRRALEKLRVCLDHKHER